MKPIQLWAGLAVLSLAMPLWAASPATNAIPLAGDLLRSAYLSVVDAELARSEQQPVESAAAYRKALETYARIQAQYPGWQTAMVSYRVAECQNALAALETVPDHAAVAAGTTNTEERIQDLLTELREVRLALAAQPEPPSVVAQKLLLKERDRLRDQLEDQTRDNRSLERKLAKLQARLKGAGKGESTNTQFNAVAGAVKAEARRLLEQDKTAEAILLLKEAAELIPADSGLILSLGKAQCRVARFADCIQTLRPFDVRSPVNGEAMLILGTAYMGLGQIGEARVAMEKSLKLNPNSAEAHYNMAQILVSVLPADADGAQQHYLKALELGLRADPDFENTLRMNLVITKIKKHNAQTRSVGADRSTPRAIPTPAP